AIDEIAAMSRTSLRIIAPREAVEDRFLPFAQLPTQLLGDLPLLVDEVVLLRRVVAQVEQLPRFLVRFASSAGADDELEAIVQDGPGALEVPLGDLAEADVLEGARELVPHPLDQRRRPLLERRIDVRLRPAA